MNNLFWPDENNNEQCFPAHIVQGFQQCFSTLLHLIDGYNSASTMLSNIVDNIEQCGQQNIVQACFHQARTGCSFLAVYTVLNKYRNKNSALNYLTQHER